LLRHADQALYVAKGAGRNRFGYFTPALQVAAQARMRLTNDLRQALELGQFSLHFQPMIHLATGEVHKAEALLRWKHPQRGNVSPGEFIPAAEAGGLIVEIGEWVLHEAARWLKRWRTGAHRELQVSVTSRRSNSTATARAMAAGFRIWSRSTCRAGASSSRSPKACCSTRRRRSTKNCSNCAKRAFKLLSTTSESVIHPSRT